MTFTIRIRGDSSAPIVREYECEACGTFAVTEPRDEQPPVWRDCPSCGAHAHFVLSAPMGRVKAGEVIRGSSDERPPHALDTRALAEGMPLHEWRARQTKIGLEQQRKRNRKAVS